MKIFIKVILGLILFFTLFSDTFAVGFLDKIYQPHLEVVAYNEVLESIKNHTLESVSIFTDDELKRKWSNVIVSLGILVILAILIKIGVSIALGSKNDLKKDLVFLLLLFFIASIFTPFFSFISGKIAGKEGYYTDKKTGKEYARVYLPTNTSLVVTNKYVDSKGYTHKYNEVFEKRKNVFTEQNSFWGNDYLGLPAKVVQTQWVADEGVPENRYSKAFYSVSVDELFKGMVWPIKELTRKECKINVNLYLEKGDGAPLSFAEAVGKEEEWKQKSEMWFTGNEEVVTSKLTGEIISDEVEYIKQNDCSVGLFMLSNQFVGGQTMNLKKGVNKFEGPSYLTDMYYDKEEGDERFELLNFLNNASKAELLYRNEYVKEIWGNLSYAQQKRLIYTEEAIYQLNRLALSDKEKVKEDIEVKEAMLACGRIITDHTQGNDDFRKCLRADIFGDTTIYTQEATKSIGLLGKNKDINKGYIFPVPQTQDWDGPMYYRIGRNLLSFLKLSNYGKDKEVKKEEKGFWDSVKEQLEKIDLVKVKYGEDQFKATDSNLTFSQQKFLPQLASFEAYDLDGNGIDDRKDWASKGKNKLEEKYHGYFYGNSLWENSYVSLRSKNLNYIKKPLYKINLEDSTITKLLNLKSFVSFGEESKIAVGITEAANYKKVKMDSEYLNGKEYLFMLLKKSRIKDISGGDYFDTSGKYGKIVVPYNPNTLKKTGLNLIIKNQKELATFLNPNLSTIVYTDKNLTKKEEINKIYKLTPKGVFIPKDKNYIKDSKLGYPGGSTVDPEGEYLIRSGSSFFYCSNKSKFKEFQKDKTKCELKSKKDNLSYSEYIQKKTVDGFFTNRILSIKNIKSGKGYDYTLEKIVNIGNLNKFNYVLIPNTQFTFPLNHKTYTYINLINGFAIKLSSIPTNYRKVNRIITDSGNGGNIKAGEYKGTNAKKISVWLAPSGKYGRLEDLKLHSADFDNLGEEYSSGKARVLLNPKYNPPLEFVPENEHYLPEYKKSDKKCLVNSDYTTKYKELFDYYPGKPLDFLDKCSLIGNHMRLTDIRLINVVQEEALFNISAESESFTHIFIPLLSNKYIKTFSKDRREQNYAGEAKDTGGLIGSKRISGIVIKEGDVIVLKPGVIVGAYDYPFTILVPKKILPYLNFVATDNPLLPKTRSKVYKGGVYSVISGLLSFFKEGSISKGLFGSPIDVSNEEKYSDYSKNKMESRPEALKAIEGYVPDRYFSAYYGDAYYSEVESGQGSSLMSSITSFILSFMDAILAYRVEILKFMYIVGPLLVFTLLFEATRKIFSGVLAITIMLLILPIIILFIVNLFT